jgi:ATP-binding cassette subfamily F protein 3
MIRFDNVTRALPDRILFKDTSLLIKGKDRIGLVGPNGAGKTTLLRMILGSEQPDEGKVMVERGITLGYLPQDIIPGSNNSILMEVLGFFPEIEKLEGKMAGLSRKIAKNPNDEGLLRLLGETQAQFEQIGGWTIERRAKEHLSGMGFTADQFDQAMNTFSGGWRMRVVLAGILLQQPDVLLLDEPTNHLDLSATIWLEDFLSEWQGCMVIISHDREFLNRSVTNILEIDRGQAYYYTGNYNSYRKQKKIRNDQQKAAYQNQQRKIVEIQRFIERFRYKESKARQVQSRIKMLEKLEKIEIPESESVALSVNIPKPSRGDLKVVTLKGVDKYYGDNQVYNGLDFVIQRGEKIGLVGENGSGKSTFLKLLAGIELQSHGNLTWGKNIEKEYFAQHQTESLDSDKTVYEIIEYVASDWTVGQIRNYLGGFRFIGEDINKKISVLSGGEKSRLALAKMLVHPSHLLLLDEPTNHLDIASRNVVEMALKDYPGALVCISHDRHFLNTVTHVTGEVGNGGIKLYQGNYDYYKWKNEDRKTEHLEESTGVPNIGRKEPQRKRDYYQQRKLTKNRIEKIGLLLADIEKQLTQLKESMAHPEKAVDHEFLNDALKKEQALEEQYLLLTDELENLRAKIENQG